MSIQKTGPANYRYQDRVAVWLALVHFEKKDLEVWNDQDGINEDITLRYKENGTSFEVEFQSKGSKEFSLNLLVDCLKHFGDHQSHTCLLDKLINGAKVIITTKGRCEDATKPFILRHEELHLATTPRKITNDTVKQIIEVINKRCSSAPQDSSLTKKRNSHCLSLTANSLSSLATAISNISIIELLRERDVIEESKRILIERHAVPYDLAEQAVDELRDAARDAVEKQCNIFPKAREIITNYSQKKYGIPDYVDRGNEKEWLNELRQKNILLLSGVPRCGKSVSGSNILDIMAHEGYEVKKTSQIQSAIDFLNSSYTPRCVLLEDPFGSRGIIEDKIARKSHEIRRLCETTNVGRKLVVCQSQEELMRAFSQDDLTSCRIGTHDWHDLSVHSSDFLLSIWSNLKKGKNIPGYIYAPVKKLLEENKTIEPGALEHLAYNYHLIPRPYSKDTLLTFARQGAEDLSSLLNEELGQEAVILLGVLAFVLFSNSSIAIEDLAFILSSGREEESLPGLKDSPGQAYSFGDLEFNSALEYSEKYQLPEDFENLLDLFDRRHMLTWDQNKISFRHSFYQATAELILKKASRKSLSTIMTHCNRALGCTSPQTAISMAKSIPFLEKLINKSHKKDILSLAFKTRLSVYPTTYHCVTSFIFNNTEFLNEEQKEIFLNHPEGLQASLFDFEWKDGEAWVPDNISFLKSLSPLPEEFTPEWLSKQVAALNSPTSPSPTPETAATILKYYSNHPEDITLPTARSFMEYDLASIRSETTKIWLKLDRSEDEELLKRIFKDDVPTIISAAYTAIAEGWEDISINRRSSLLSNLITATQSPLNTVVLFGKLVNFCEYGHNYSWEIFLSLMPAVLKGDEPLQVLNTSRFHYVIRQAVRHNQTKDLLPLFTSWLSRIEKWIESNRFDEFQIAIVPLLIHSTKDHPSLREEHSHKLLQQKNTPAAMVFLGAYIDEWENITEQEQNTIFALLQSQRNDKAWLQATALTRHKVHPEIQKLILGQSAFFNKPAAEIINDMDKMLFEYCVHIYCGSPQPLWYYAIHHKNHDLWEPILFEIGKDVTNPLFPLALSDYILHSKEDTIGELITLNLGQEELFFEALLKEAVIHRIPHIPNVWSALLDAAPNDEIRKEWIGRIATTFSNSLGGLSEIKSFFNKKEYLNMFAEHVKNDISCIDIVRVYAQRIPDTDSGKIELLNFAKVFAALNPKFHKTISEMTVLLVNRGLKNTDEYKELEAMRRARINARSQETTIYEADIQDWTLPLH